MYKVETLDRVSDKSASSRSTEAAKETLSVSAIQKWLISEISQLLSLDAGSLSVAEPFADYGLSSMTGVVLSGNIEEWLDIKLDPSVAWDYPTIESLATHLAEEVKSQKLAACI
jgi:acyl carrier protein